VTASSEQRVDDAAGLWRAAVARRQKVFVRATAKDNGRRMGLDDP
jgi:hypothetical protein